MTNNNLQKNTQKTKDRVTRNAIKTGGELRLSGRVIMSCSTCGTYRGTPATSFSLSLTVDNGEPQVVKILILMRWSPITSRDGKMTQCIKSFHYIMSCNYLKQESEKY